MMVVEVEAVPLYGYRKTGDKGISERADCVILIKLVLFIKHNKKKRDILILYTGGL